MVISTLYPPPSDGSQLGVLQWRYLAGDNTYSPIVGLDSSVYVISRNDISKNYLYSIAPPSDNSQYGVLLWSYPNDEHSPDIVASPALASDGSIYLGTESTSVNAGWASGFFDAVKNGGRQWYYSFNGENTDYQYYASPSVSASGRIYVECTCGFVNGLYAIDPPDSGGSRASDAWFYESDSSLVYSPAVGDSIYIGSSDSNLNAISGGSLKWQYQIDSEISSSPTIDTDGNIYFGSSDGYLYAVAPPEDDGKIGVLLWRYQTESRVYGPTIGADGVVYVGNSNGYLHAISSPEDDSKIGVLLWKYHTAGAVSSSPAISSDGIIYIGSNDGYLYAIYSSSPGLADSAWPRTSYDNQNVRRANIAPIAEAGSDQSVAAGATVNLDGSSSNDSDGAIIDYYWQETSGFDISILNNNSAQASFTAPNNLSSDGILTIQLTVTDNSGATATDTLEVSVPANP